MSDTTFRGSSAGEAKPTADSPSPTTPDVPNRGGTKKPIALYMDMNGYPYSAEYFEIKDIWDNPKLTYKDDLSHIDEYYKNKVESNKIKDGEDSFKELIKEAEKATNTKNSPTSVKIAKIAEWMRFMNKMDKIERNAQTYGNSDSGR